METRICKDCGQELPLSEEYFYKRKKNNSFHIRCKKCFIERQKKYYKTHKETYHQYYEKNKEKILNYTKIYSKNNREEVNKSYLRKFHKRKAAKISNGGSFTQTEWENCLKFFNYKCCYSGIDLDDKNISVDHVVPLKNGGTNYIYNIVCCDRLINSIKSCRDMVEWYRRQEYFNEDRLNKIYEWIELNKSDQN